MKKKLGVKKRKDKKEKKSKKTYQTSHPAPDPLPSNVSNIEQPSKKSKSRRHKDEKTFQYVEPVSDSLVDLENFENNVNPNIPENPKPNIHSEKSSLTKTYDYPMKGLAPRNWKELFWKYFKLHNVKTLLFLFIAIASGIALAAKPEREEELFIYALSYDSPIVVPLDKSSSFIEYTIHMTPNTNITQLNLYLQYFDLNEEHPEWIDLYSTPLEGDIDSTVILKNQYIDLLDFNLPEHAALRFRITAENISPVAISFIAQAIPHLAKYEIVFAALLLISLYVMITLEFFHRTVCSLIVAFIALSVVAQLHYRPSFDTIVSWIDWEVMGLLFGMMIIIGIMQDTGFFEFAAIKTYKLSNGNIWRLTVLLSIFTGIVSSFLDNVTAMIVVIPVTLQLCKVLNIPPNIVVMTEIMSSNIGGCSTIVGDPPNLIVAGQKYIEKEINALQWSLHMFPGVILCFITTLLYMWKFHAKNLVQDKISVIRSEIEVWKKALLKHREGQSLHQKEMRQKILNHIEDLEIELRGEELSDASLSIVRNKSMEELEFMYRIKDMPLLIKSSFVVSGVIVLFFIRHLVGLELSLAWIAVIGAIIQIIISGITDIEEVMNKVEFSTLMFFAALYVLMNSLSELGLIRGIADLLKYIIESVPAGELRLWVAILVLLWFSAIASSFIDNVPYVATIAPVIVELAESDLGLPIGPLVWATIFGSALGGNGTLIGASSNVIAVGQAEQAGYQIKMWEFSKVSYPIMLITVFVATVYLSIFHVAVPWY